MTSRFRTCPPWAALALVAVSRAAAAQEPYPGFDAYVTKSMQTLKLPGAAVAIVRNDSVIYLKGYGVLSKTNKAPVDAQTLFEIGSSSKAFTATAVAMMVTDSKMAFDDPITKFLPSFRMYDPEASAQVTLRDALAHRSGIGRGELVWLDGGGTREDIMRRVRFLKNESPFRTKFSYQNMMFLVAGEAAGTAAGTSWDDVIQNRIFAPLGMTSSAPTLKAVKTTNLALPHVMEADTASARPSFDGDNIAPAGAILSNAHDMAEWLRFQLNDGQVNGKRLVSSAALKETHTPQILLNGALGASEGTIFSTYGMGWIVQDYRHELVWQHGGNTPGMTTAVGMLPEKKFGIVVLSNMDHSGLPDALMRYAFDRHLGAPVKDYVAEGLARVAVAAAAAARRAPADTAPPHVAAPMPLPMASFVGTYADSLYGEATVAIKDGKLEMTRGVQHGTLEYWNAGNFKWNSNASIGGPNGPTTFIRFEIGPDNRVSGLWYGLAPDVYLLGKKRPAAARGGRGSGEN